jgi:CDP-paratose 2-epimerase
LRVLVTGGAGFVGSHVAASLAERHPDWSLTALDNLHRQGSELNLSHLEAAGVRFVRADVRDRETLVKMEPLDALIECSAEPSALAGLDGATAYPFETNLVGAYNCLELARRHKAQFVFLSTSRIYPYARLRELRLSERETRFELAEQQPMSGVSSAGIAEDFPLWGPRTFYGATKLAAEHLVTEYAAALGLDTIINRCGVIAGPRQMGRIDQGVFALWVLHHHFGRPLAYIGYQGSGRQVRDLLAVHDLVDLLEEQLLERDLWRGFVGNVGGGRDFSLSLVEATALSVELTGREVPIEPVPEPRPGDVPLYISDCSALFARTRWRPRTGPREVIAAMVEWVESDAPEIAGALGFDRSER